MEEGGGANEHVRLLGKISEPVAFTDFHLSHIQLPQHPWRTLMSWEAVHRLNSGGALAKQKLDDLRGSDDIEKWLELTGYSVRRSYSNGGGMKGKGSTYAFISSLLEACGKSNGFPGKFGLYTSPHRKHIRERIQSNGIPISEDVFTKRLFEVWEKTLYYPTAHLDIPRYLQLLALMSYHVFLPEVDAAIYEAHLGGEYEASNIVQNPVVTAVTSIEMDHIHLLGPSIQDMHT
ncbi:folylpolyglutamate synthase [Venturia nashicola]|uniref:Folylpolyglutamate synthase n=1 Tax=Venturia nashicola TaxID=86259 RepID=A0A4Z1NW80_9PEZI|nr:folylpolyglutamate synthase [Venturia nashicola]